MCGVIRKHLPFNYPAECINDLQQKKKFPGNLENKCFWFKGNGYTIFVYILNHSTDSTSGSIISEYRPENSLERGL